MVRVGGAVNMGGLVSFPTDPQLVEALVEAFADRSPLLRAMTETGGFGSVQVPLEIAISGLRCVLCPRALLRARPHSQLIEYLLVRLFVYCGIFSASEVANVYGRGF